MEMMRDFNPHEREARDIDSDAGVLQIKILIHTSVKLVTWSVTFLSERSVYFNPHEREARDLRTATAEGEDSDFNPHEREARDAISPHYEVAEVVILIHTSVKLVTGSFALGI